jgi:hypothetical protein
MRGISISLVILAICVIGCATTKRADKNVHVTLIRKAPGKQLLAITRDEWGGLWGAHGYIGYERVGYWAALEGTGPVYVNPHFQDSPSDFKCVGTITINQQTNSVTIEMERIVSGSRQPQETIPHPINGRYVIDSIRDARPEEGWF